jgi:hypothetical protein
MLATLQALGVMPSFSPNFGTSNGRTPRQRWVSVIFGSYHVAM